jgi:hypothetical protein
VNEEPSKRYEVQRFGGNAGIPLVRVQWCRDCGVPVMERMIHDEFHAKIDKAAGLAGQLGIIG